MNACPHIHMCEHVSMQTHTETHSLSELPKKPQNSLLSVNCVGN